jgi:tryptophanyl-tRNA synthetase
LLTIHSALSGKKISDLENEFAGKGYGDFKGAVAEVVVEYLRPIRARALELLEDERHLVEMLHTGADKARTVASATVAQSYKNLGLVL